MPFLPFTQDPSLSGKAAFRPMRKRWDEWPLPASRLRQNGAIETGNMTLGADRIAFDNGKSVAGMKIASAKEGQWDSLAPATPLLRFLNLGCACGLPKMLKSLSLPQGER